ncbi:hypothetical protein F5Y10DRAFT_247168 [Nemania abortiva]|nr:hypothetical protein F5Y10DRAFT_247168 [Nemania abortiva]
MNTNSLHCSTARQTVIMVSFAGWPLKAGSGFVIAATYSIMLWLFDAWDHPAERIGIADLSWFLVSCVMLGLAHVYPGLGRVPDHLMDNIFSFFAEPHVRIVQHVVATVAASWFVIRVPTIFLGYLFRKESPGSNEARSPHEPFVQGSHEQQNIYWLTREIAKNCTVHLQEHFGGAGCQLAPGASLEQIRDLDRLLWVELPKDYKIFLQLTNGLHEVLDGGDHGLQFLSTNSGHWLETVSPARQDIRATWLIESMFGPGTRKELAEQVVGGKDVRHRTSFVKIADRVTGVGGVYLVPAEDCRSIAREWVPSALHDSGRCGKLIGEIMHHCDIYFGGRSERPRLLQDWDDWVVLQVDQNGNRCRLYPSFTALLQTLSEISRRPSSDIFGMPGILEDPTYAEYCYLRWEWELRRRSMAD